MAGGGGTRLWPLSRRARPKPLLPLAGGVSPLRRAVDLAAKVAGKEHVWVVAGQTALRRVRAHLGSGRRVHAIAEPLPRNTAAALVLGAVQIRRLRGDAWLLCLPADQWVRRPEAFSRLVRRIVSGAEEDSLITFGIPPGRANPGYGYIDVGDPLTSILRRARRFVEKPPEAAAARYVRSGRWLWNSGMFLWRSETFLLEVERLLPEVLRAASELLAGAHVSHRNALLRWRQLESISVDHAILSHARRVAVATGTFGWCDLGSWDAVASILPAAGDGTRYRGLYRSRDGRDCLVYAPGHLTFNLGVRGVGLVVTRDAVLLFDRRRHERVREVVDRLARERGLVGYL